MVRFRGRARQALASARMVVGLVLATSLAATAGPSQTQRLATLPSAAVAPNAVTFNRDIAPLFFEHCSTCHRPGTRSPVQPPDLQRRAAVGARHQAGDLDPFDAALEAGAGVRRSVHPVTGG